MADKARLTLKTAQKFVERFFPEADCYEVKLEDGTLWRVLDDCDVNQDAVVAVLGESTASEGDAWLVAARALKRGGE